MEQVLSLENVTVIRRENTILKNISLPFYKNEIVALVGPNGAGKTTLFKTLLGEIPYKGEIRWANQKEGNERCKIGYVPQHLTFDQMIPLTVLELFTACLTKRPVWLKPQKAFREKVTAALEDVAIPYVLHRKIGLLSGGELQRVLLALALMPTPELLLLDEPISGVDCDGQKLFYERVKYLKEKYQMAIVLISHDLEKLGYVADRKVVLDKEIIAVEKDSYTEQKIGGVIKNDGLNLSNHQAVLTV